MAKKTFDASQAKATLEAMAATARENDGHLEFLTPPTVGDLTNMEEYDSSTYLCCPFRKKDDIWKVLWIPFGNMCSGFEFHLNGVHFFNSEAAYICGLFSEDKPEHSEIQQILVNNANGKTAKGDIRFRNIDIARKDWWDGLNIQWMMYVVWSKIRDNEDFRKLLMAVPDGAIIIEDSTYHKTKKDHDPAIYWGTRNLERKEYLTLHKKYLKATAPEMKKGTLKKELLKAYNDFVDFGVYRGRNVMGKILTICKNSLAAGTEPPIDYEFLRGKHIHLLGKELEFI